jgi:hypothetical protein
LFFYCSTNCLVLPSFILGILAGGHFYHLFEW